MKMSICYDVQIVHILPELKYDTLLHSAYKNMNVTSNTHLMKPCTL